MFESCQLHQAVQVGRREVEGGGGERQITFKVPTCLREAHQPQQADWNGRRQCVMFLTSVQFLYVASPREQSSGARSGVEPPTSHTAYGCITPEGRTVGEAEGSP